MELLNLLFICILVMVDVASNWFIPAISLEFGKFISNRFELGKITELLSVAMSISAVSAIILYILNRWLNFIAPENTPLHREILWALYTVNFVWIIVAVRYLLTTNLDEHVKQESEHGSFLRTSMGFFAGVILYVCLKPIGYSNLRDYYIAPDKQDEY